MQPVYHSVYNGIMGIIQNKQESRTELQERIAAELRAKLAAKAKVEDGFNTDPHLKEADAVEDSAYVEGYKRTTTLAPVWALIFFAAIVVFIYFVMQASK